MFLLIHSIIILQEFLYPAQDCLESGANFGNTGFIPGLSLGTMHIPPHMFNITGMFQRMKETRGAGGNPPGEHAKLCTDRKIRIQHEILELWKAMLPNTIYIIMKIEPLHSCNSSQMTKCSKDSMSERYEVEEKPSVSSMNIYTSVSLIFKGFK